MKLNPTLVTNIPYDQNDQSGQKSDLDGQCDQNSRSDFG